MSVDLTGDRSLTLRHTMQNNIPLSSDCAEVMKHLHFLWSFDIHLETYSEGKKIKSIRHPALKED